MNTLEAWEVTEGAPEIVVADIDSGIDLSHPDLVGNLWVNPKETSSGSGVDHDGNGFPNDVHGFDFYAWKGDPIDENGHGTHTAGTIAASRNDLGVIGVAPRVKIMPLRFLGPQGQGSTYGAIQAIQYAVKMGARVISASWGGDGFSSLLAQAVKDAQDAGVIFVAAAGNDGRDLSRTPSYPASLPDVFTVGSSSLSDRLSTFSNYGPSTVLVSAPGEKIYSTYPGGNYASMSGTSMATPQVSGAVALALSKNKSIPASQIRSVMCSTSDPLSNGGTQCGRINIGRFLKAI
jgi:subtilisin family serine protease